MHLHIGCFQHPLIPQISNDNVPYPPKLCETADANIFILLGANTSLLLGATAYCGASPPKPLFTELYPLHGTIQLQLKIVSSLSPWQWDSQYRECDVSSTKGCKKALQHSNWGSKNERLRQLIYKYHVVLTDFMVTIMWTWLTIFGWLHPV